MFHVRQADSLEITDDDSEVVMLVKELLETRIRPFVNEDGGDIVFVGFDEASGLVRLSLIGACASCPSSTVTLRHGVENMLKHYIPEVAGVESVDAEDVGDACVVCKRGVAVGADASVHTG